MDLPTVIVTGAGSGVGRAAALALAREGFAVVLNGRNRATLDEVAALTFTSSAVVPGDVSSPDLAPRLVEAALARFGRLDAIVNNAGSAQLIPVEKTTVELLQSTFATHVFGAMLLVKAAWSALCAQPRAAVVNVSSMAAQDPLPGFAVYGAAKAALESLTRSIVREGQQCGVEAYSLRLGAVDTPLLRRLLQERSLEVGVPLAPETVADVIAACVRGARRFDNGQVIEVRA